MTRSLTRQKPLHPLILVRSKYAWPPYNDMFMLVGAFNFLIRTLKLNWFDITIAAIPGMSCYGLAANVTGTLIPGHTNAITSIYISMYQNINLMKYRGAISITGDQFRLTTYLHFWKRWLIILRRSPENMCRYVMSPTSHINYTFL